MPNREGFPVFREVHASMKWGLFYLGLISKSGFLSYSRKCNNLCVYPNGSHTRH